MTSRCGLPFSSRCNSIPPLDYDWPAQMKTIGGLSTDVKFTTSSVYFSSDYLGRPDRFGPGASPGGLTQSVVEASPCRDAEDHPSKPYPPSLLVSRHGVTIRYQDKEGFHQTCLAYLLAGEKFTGSCVVQYFDNDRETVLPRIKAMLDSVRPVR